MQMKWLGHYWCKVGATLRAQLNHTSVWSSKFPKFFLNGNLKKKLLAWGSISENNDINDVYFSSRNAYLANDIETSNLLSVVKVVLLRLKAVA